MIINILTGALQKNSKVKNGNLKKSAIPLEFNPDSLTALKKISSFKFLFIYASARS